jgi:glucose-6-phosphate 1-dehydrogenase
MRGDQTLFARTDAVEHCWRVLDPAIAARVPIHRYRPGTWGPEAAGQLPPQRIWHEPG